MSHIFVTGGLGFLGYHLCNELVGLGHKVTIFDKFVNYIEPEKSNYYFYLNKRLNVLKNITTIVRGDIKCRTSIRKAIRDADPDIVIHLAAIPLASFSKKYPEEMLETNLIGTVKVLEALEDTKVERFVYASSSFVYGDFKYEPCDEDHPTNPIDMYGTTKLAGEKFTKLYCKQFGISWVIVRPSAVYGPTDCNQRVSQIFLENKLRGLPVFLEEGGNGTLDFTYVKDTAMGFVLCAVHKDAPNRIFNITYGKARFIKTYANILGCQTLDVQSDKERPKRGTLDIRKARAILGYEPMYPLEKGLKEYEEYVKGVQIE
jgi:UDP-glucose 4-epimerase